MNFPRANVPLTGPEPDACPDNVGDFKAINLRTSRGQRPPGTISALTHSFVLGVKRLTISCHNLGIKHKPWRPSVQIKTPILSRVVAGVIAFRLAHGTVSLDIGQDSSLPICQGFRRGPTGHHIAPIKLAEV